jgi:hypothetical protein
MLSRQEGVDRGALRDGMRALQEQTTAEIKELLTADQYDAFLKIQREDTGGRGPGQGRGGRGR